MNHLYIIFPVLIAFQVMTFYHHNRALSFAHIKTKIVYPDLTIHCEWENLDKFGIIYFRQNILLSA